MQKQCHILSQAICDVILRDTFSVVLTLWASLQLTWVTMLLFVQSVQIARAKTTYESMRGHIDHGSRASDTITAALTSGSTSLDGAQLSSDGGSHMHHGHRHGFGGGFFAQWKKLLGLDTFMATAQGGLDRSPSNRDQNPFSRGIYTNCKDFWCDPAPLFGQRDVGAAILDGEPIDYTKMYEAPPRMKFRRRHEGEDAMYQSITTDNIV